MGIEVGFPVEALILLIAIAYGVFQYNRRDPANEARTDAPRAGMTRPRMTRP